MPKSATDVMGDVVFSAVVDAMVALRTEAKGVANALLRDVNAVHANTTLEDLPEPLQAAITASVRAAFDRMRKEGYTMSGAGAVGPGSRPAGPPRAPGSPPRGPSGPPPRPRGPRR